MNRIHVILKFENSDYRGMWSDSCTIHTRNNKGKKIKLIFQILLILFLGGTWRTFIAFNEIQACVEALILCLGVRGKLF